MSISLQNQEVHDWFGEERKDKRQKKDSFLFLFFYKKK